MQTTWLSFYAVITLEFAPTRMWVQCSVVMPPFYITSEVKHIVCTQTDACIFSLGSLSKYWKQYRKPTKCYRMLKSIELLQLLQQTFAFTDSAHKRINCCISLLTKLRYHRLTVGNSLGNLRTLQLLFKFFEPQIQLNAKQKKTNYSTYRNDAY